MRHRRSLTRGLLASTVTLAGLAGATAPALAGPSAPDTFRRIATFPIFLNSSIENETVAEIVAANAAGTILAYTDSSLERLGFVDITDPANPVAAGTVELPGEPTSVSIVDGLALVCVNTSADFVNTSGELLVIDIDTLDVVRSLPLGGQPDSIALSPDGRYGAIAIENERDEDLGDGAPPQLPAGFVVIVDLVGPPADWTLREVPLVGVADLFGEDPEPEFIDINKGNIAAVTLQENNHIALIDLATGVVVGDFSAGTADLFGVDVEEEDVISQDGVLMDVPREPDAITWIGPMTLATADEGDLDGGSRGFTTWLSNGSVLSEAGTDLEDLVTRIGHYPEGRSENKGNEPESVEFAQFDGQSYLFVGSERSSVVAVYRIPGIETISTMPQIFGAMTPEYLQVLPAGLGPEGLLAIPGRDLLVVANENDERDAKFRASIMIYRRGLEPNYPTLTSANRNSGSPIPWGALSALSIDPNDANVMWTAHDSFYRENRLLRIDRGVEPAMIDAELSIDDAGDVLLTALQGLKSQLPGTDDFDPADIVNADGTVNMDPEGLAVMPDGSFWIASEGTGNLVDGISDPDDRPFERPNMLVKVSTSGAITNVVFPPIELTRNQLRFGFEGVTRVETKAGPRLVVAWQRAWTAAGDPNGEIARLGLVDPATGDWSFAAYPLEAPASANGGWVGLSEIVAAGGELFVVERDNQGGPDAAIKWITAVPFDAADFAPFKPKSGRPLPILGKSVAIDLLDAGVFDAWAGFVPEKVEGLAVTPDGRAIIVNDNDGVDDNTGETLLIELGVIGR